MIYPTYGLIVEHVHQSNFWLKLKYPEEGAHLWVCSGFIINEVDSTYLGEFRMTVRELENLYQQATLVEVYQLNEQRS